MIVNFSVQNFGSIREKQTLSFEADRSKHLEDYYVINTNGLRLLKLGLIYGANASGKTTILMALDFLRDLVVHPKKKKNDNFNNEFKPFLFDSVSNFQNTLFSIEFIQNSIRYEYEVELNHQAIVKEELNFHNPGKSNVFKRTTDLDKQFSEVIFGNKIKKDKSVEKTLESNTLWNNTVFGGGLKTNINIKELKDATDWFSETLGELATPVTKLETFVFRQISRNHINNEILIDILRKSDFNITGILKEEKQTEISPTLVEFMDKEGLLSLDLLNQIKNNGTLKSFEPKLEHTINGIAYDNLRFDSESRGTQRYFGLSGILYALIDNALIIPIDELESSLHPDLFRHFLLLFLINAKQSQLIATTHNREILNDKDMFRNDAIWITDKNKSGATELYSLADFDTSVIRDTTNVLNAYKAGRLGGLPNLGDYYLDIANEK